MTKKLGAFANGISSEKLSEDWLDLGPYEHRPVNPAMLRGGRMTKQHGVAASYSPELGVSLAVNGVASGATGLIGRALAALRWGAAPAAIAASGLVGASPAMAQAAQDACVETAPGSGVFVCEDNGAAATTSQVIFGNSVDVQIEDGFEVDTTGVGGNALDVGALSGDLIISQTSGTSTLTGDRGISALGFLAFFTSPPGQATTSITTGGDVTGTASDGIYARNENFGLTIDTTAGTVTGATNGIRADNAGATPLMIPSVGAGALTITTGNVVGQNGNGIDARNAVDGTDLTINSSAGRVEAYDYAIYARNAGSGALSITTADVNSIFGRGIDARNSTNGTDLIVDTRAGNVTADSSAISVFNDGSGATTVRTGNVDGGGGVGVGGFGTGITVDTTQGTVISRSTGVSASNFGTGSVQVTTADVEAQGIDAIDVRNRVDGVDLVVDSTAGTLTADERGIYAVHYGSGNASITTAEVNAASGEAISAKSSNGFLVIDSTAGTVSSDTDVGIRAEVGSGASVSVTTSDVNGGISVAGTGDVTIDTSTGVVRAQDRAAIYVDVRGAGNTTITTGAINTLGSFGFGDGIYVQNLLGVTGAVTIDTTAGAVQTQGTGILVRNRGSGALTITSGDVSSTTGNGIDIDSGAAPVTIDTSAGSVTGAAAGIFVQQNGVEAIDITVNDVTGQGNVAIGVITGFGASIAVRGSSGDVVGNTDGIYLRTANADITVENLDSVTGQAGDGLDLGSAGGAITVSDIGTITGNGGAGILADSQGGDISIQGVGTVGGVAGTFGAGIQANATMLGGVDGNINIGDVSAIGPVTGSTNGIYARTAGTGSITIDASGDVTGGNAGILAVTYDSGSISVDTTGVAVSGGFGNGVQAVNINGSGSIDVTTGDVSSTYGDGVYVGAYAGDTVIDTTGGAITAGSNGITARNGIGASSMSITTGDITATNFGVYARGQTGDLTVNTSAGDVTANSFGLVILSDDGDATSLTTGNVTSTYGSGIFARARGRSTSLTVDTTAGSILGGYSGVVARQEGTGTLMVTTADTNATGYSGIFALTYGSDASVDSTAGTTSGGNFGVYAQNFGTGALTITTADATGTNFDGVYANAQAGATDMTIDTSAGSVTGGRNGVYAIDAGSGVLTITTADAEGLGSDGVRARKFGGTDILIDTTAGTVTGYSRGVSALLAYGGTGSISITTGAVTATNDNAVSANNSADGTDISVDTTGGPAVGGAYGVYVRNAGTGVTNVATGDVTGQRYGGVEVRASGSDVAVDTSLGTVSGGNGGVGVSHFGTTGYVTVTTADVTGAGGNGVSANTSGAGLTVDTSAGSVQGAANGLSITNSGYGSTTITTANVTGQGFYGIIVNSNGGADDVTIDSTAGAVTGANTGIRVRQYGYGSVSISTADVTGTYQYGIDLFTIGDGVTIDTSARSVFGGFSGISVRNSGYGPTSITTASVVGDGSYGITVTSYATAGDLTIDSSAGAVSGSYTGVQARQYGVGALSITTGDVTDTYGRGVYAYLGGASTGNLTVDSSAGTVMGQNGGVYALNFGLGDASITTGSVSAAYNTGIDLDSFGGNAAIDSSAGSVSGTYGIDARNYGTGTLTITTADVDGTANDGIFAANDGTDLVIDSRAGTVTGNNRGIAALSYGYYSTALSVTTADVVGQYGDGIYAVQYGYDGSLTIDSSAGSVVGAYRGIDALQYGSGELSITVNDVTGLGAEGIRATSFQPTANISIQGSSGDIVGATDGILVRTSGAAITIENLDSVTGQAGNGISAFSGGGNVTISDIDTIAGMYGSGILVFSDADVSIQGVGLIGGVTGNLGAGIFVDATPGLMGGSINIGGVTAIGGVAGANGIYARSGSIGDIIIDSTGGAVIGNFEGIQARVTGVGDISITTADVTAFTSDGIFAENFFSSGSIDIDTTAGAVDAGRLGIFVLHNGSGAVTIDTADIRAGTSFGIYVGTETGATEVSIDTSLGLVESEETGIDVRHTGSGEISITTGDVTSRVGRGISATSVSASDGISIDSSAGSVGGDTVGIYARNAGGGAVSITTADVTGSNGEGVHVRSFGTDIEVDTSAGSVTGALSGVLVSGDYISGAISVVTADVTGQMQTGIAVSGAGTDIAIDSTAGSVTGQFGGINVNSTGTGTTSIVTGDVTGVGGPGISAFTTGDDVSIDSTAGNVSGENGILIINAGTAAASVITADVDGNTGTGIIVSNSSANGATDVTIDSTAGSVSGGANGVQVFNRGTGSTAIRTGNVTGGTYNGVYAYTQGTDLTIDTSAGTATGDSRGILALHYGTGSVSISTAGVVGVIGDGLLAINSANGTDVTVDTSAGSVSGPYDGVEVFNYGSGATSVTTADVSSTIDDGVYVRGDGTDVTVDTSAGSVTGGTEGIVALNNGTGALSVTSADVTGTSSDGIYAVNSASGTDLSIDSSAGSVSGTNDGIFAYNYGTGALTIATGDVSGAAGYGVTARNRGTNLLIDTSAGTVSGGNIGVGALHNGMGNNTVITGNVVSTGSAAVSVFTSANGANTVIDTTAGVLTSTGTGIDGQSSGTGTTTITTGDIFADGAEAIDFIVFTGGGTDLVIDTTAGTLVGGTSGIRAVHGGTGVLSVATADVTGALSSGIYARNSAAGTDVVVDTSAGSVIGATDGIEAMQMGTGDVSVVTADVTGTAQYGIYLNAGPGSTSVSIDSAAGAVTGGERAITVANQGTGTLTIATGDVTGVAGNAIGAFNAATATDMVIDTAAGSVSGGDNGIVATNFGTGSLEISTADVEADAGDAILATNSADSDELVIDTSAGTVTGALQGIDARQYGAGALTITVNDVNGLAAEAIRAISTQATADVTVQGSSGDITGATDGVAVVTAGADITVDNLDSVTGQAGDGLDLASAGGAITVGDIGTITGTGGNGILADSDGGAITIDEVGLVGGVTGTAGAGILADARGGAGGVIAIGATMAIGDVTGSGNAITALTDGAGSIAIDTSAGTATGGADGVYANNAGSGSTAITTADVTGTAGVGVLAMTTGTDLSIDTTAGSASGDMGGIFAGNMGSGATAITASDVTSASGVAILAEAEGTDLVIDTSAGTVSGFQGGIVAQNTGSGSTAVTTADVTGGIEVAATGTDSSIDSTAGTVMGGLEGILLDHGGTGSASITTATVVAMNGYGIIARTSGTDLIIDSSAGTVEGAEGGIIAENAGSGTTAITTGDIVGVGGVAIEAITGMTTTGLSITTTGTTMGDAAAIAVENNGTGPTTIVNDGTLTATGGQAILLAGAASDTTNNGTLLGFVTLGDGDDALANNGTFIAEGDSDFGLGADALTNNGDFAVASGGSVALNGLESFANTGLVSLADGAIGNNLTVAGDFAGSGGSMLGIDVDFAAGAADVLTVGGAATGSTTLGISTVGDIPTTLFGDILVVDAGAGSAETAFALMGGRQTIGLIELDIAFDASNNDYFLATAPSLAAFETSNLAETARGVWQHSADAFSSQMATDRDQGTSGSNNLAGGQDSAARAWITGFGGDVERERALSTNVNGIANQFDLGYDQDAFGALAGVDFGSSTFRYGITGGYLSSEVRFAGSPNRVEYNVLTIGAYLALDTGPFFANILAKYDDIDGQLSSATGGVVSELDGSAFGVQGEIGALLGDRTGFFFEPSASLAYNNADLDTLTTAQGTFAFEEGDSLLGKVGARLGSGFQSGETPGAIYVGARYVHEFEGEDSVIFASGSRTATFGNLPVDDYAELTAGLSLGGEDDALSGGFRGQVLVGEDISGFGVSANVRFRF